MNEYEFGHFCQGKVDWSSKMKMLGKAQLPSDDKHHSAQTIQELHKNVITRL